MSEASWHSGPRAGCSVERDSFREVAVAKSPIEGEAVPNKFSSRFMAIPYVPSRSTGFQTATHARFGDQSIFLSWLVGPTNVLRVGWSKTIGYSRRAKPACRHSTERGALC